MSPEQSPHKIGKSVGEKLRAARIAQHYTQSQLAAPDFSVSYISAIERGQIHPSLRALEILAGRLGLSSIQLLPVRSQQEERLSSLLDTPEQDKEESDLLLLETHLQIRQSNVRQAITQLEKLSTKRLQPLQQLQHHYLLGWGYFKLTQFQECDYILAEALSLAKELKVSYLHMHILNIQALTQAALRNYAQAIQTHQDCLELLETVTPRDPFFMAQIYMSMGQHYTQLGNHGQAQQMFQQAIEITEQLAQNNELPTTYLKISQSYSEAKEYELATLYAYKAMEWYSQETIKQLHTKLYYYLGRASVKTDSEKSKALLEEMLQQPAILRNVQIHACLLARSAEWHLMHHDVTTACQQAHQACELTTPYGENLIRADALIMLGRIEYAQKNYASGDQHFSVGLAMLEHLESHEELAEESVRYAELLEQIGKAHEAFSYFRRAFQSQQKIGK